MYDYLGIYGWEMNVQSPFTEERTMIQSQPEADGLDAEWSVAKRGHLKGRSNWSDTHEQRQRQSLLKMWARQAASCYNFPLSWA